MSSFNKITFVRSLFCAALAVLVIGVGSASAQTVFLGTMESMSLGELTIAGGPYAADIGTLQREDDGSGGRQANVINDPFATGHGKILQMIDGNATTDHRLGLYAIGTAGLVASQSPKLTFDVYLPSAGSPPYNPFWVTRQLDNDSQKLSSGFYMRDDRNFGLSSYSSLNDQPPANSLLEDQWMNVEVSLDLVNGTFDVKIYQETTANLIYSKTGLDNQAGATGDPTNVGIVGLFTHAGTQTGTHYLDNIRLVPEPSTALLVVLGGGGLALFRRRMRRLG